MSQFGRPRILIGVAWGLVTALILAGVACGGEAPTRRNVLMIAIDDMNDWVGPLGAHPMARTPNLDRLAERGTTFLNAHVQAPLCNPSRVSLLLGLRPSTTGVYGLAPLHWNVPELAVRPTVFEHFRSHGYRVAIGGKVFHGMPPPALRSKFADTWGPMPGAGVRPPSKLVSPTPMGNHPAMDWGVVTNGDEEFGDYRLASWACAELKVCATNQPFFMAVGFFFPHVPCYANAKWFEPFPDDDSVLPIVRDDDRDDCPRFSWYLHWYLPEPRLRWLRDQGQWRNFVRSYLACTYFMDAQLGRVLDALESLGLADRTIVVVWGDNGFHLGEKLITGKNTLWERSTRVPLIFAGPGVASGARRAQPAELLDIYPTLAELCGLPRPEGLEGRSLLPQLRDPPAPRTAPAITTHNQGNHSVRSERWRYIRYADGTEELYDMVHDPHEWTNLARDPRYADVLAEHRRWLPRRDADPVQGSADRVLVYDPETDTAVWEGRPVRREDPIPE